MKAKIVMALVLVAALAAAFFVTGNGGGEQAVQPPGFEQPQNEQALKGLQINN